MTRDKAFPGEGRAAAKDAGRSGLCLFKDRKPLDQAGWSARSKVRKGQTVPGGEVCVRKSGSSSSCKGNYT